MKQHRVGNKRRLQRKITPSLHQIQMRRWLVGLIVVSLLVFAGLFYFLNRINTRL